MKLVFQFVCIILLFAGCSKDNRERFEQRLKVRVSLPTDYNLISTYYTKVLDVSSFYQLGLDAHGYNATQVEEVYASSAELRQYQSNNPLSFIEKVSIRIYPRGQTVSFKEMYYFDFVSINEDENINLVTGIANLEPIISSELFDIWVGLKYRTFIPPGTELELDFGYNVFIKN